MMPYLNYYENRAIIDKKWKEAVKEVETIKTRHTSILEKKLGKIKNIHG